MIALVYLAAVVAANLIVQAFGPPATVPVAFVLIGATLSIRDRLHDAYGVHVVGFLILAGAILSALFGAPRIALASGVAFLVSEFADTAVYHALRRKRWYTRVNGSNVVGALVDSLVFPTIAFGGFLWPIVLGQFFAKTIGGGVWSAVLRSRRARLSAAATLAFLFGGVALEAQESAPKPPWIVVQAQAGPIFYPWESKPIGNYGANVLLFPPKPFHRFSLLSVYSRDVTPGAQWVGIVALQFRVWSR
jgi:hypothetical protein